MASPPERPLSDPLLEIDAGPRDVSGAPVRAPIGNSIKTLLLLVALLLAGAVVWWVRRPSDLTGRIGGREWVIVDVDGAAAVNDAGTASTFVLDGTGEVRGMLACNTAIGRWSFDTSSQQLAIEWGRQSLVACADTPTTYLIDGGEVDLDGDTMRVQNDDGSSRSIPLTDRAPASAEELAGTWEGGGSTVEFGPRGLLRVDECSGSWMASGAGIAVRFDDPEPLECGLASIWLRSPVIVPVRFEDALFLHREAATFPLDRDVLRFDLVAAAGATRLDGS